MINSMFFFILTLVISAGVGFFLSAATSVVHASRELRAIPGISRASRCHPGLHYLHRFLHTGKRGYDRFGNSLWPKDRLSRRRDWRQSRRALLFSAGAHFPAGKSHPLGGWESKISFP